jgi:Ca2+-binding RTX toxin-like protein
MLKTCTRTPLGRVLGLSLLAILALDAAPAAADETYVVDQDAGSGAAGALFRVDTASGNRSLVSDFGNAAQGPLGSDPSGLALEASGTVLVIDKDAGTDFGGALFRVDPASGNRSLVSDFGNPAQGPLGSAPFGLALEAAGTVLVIDDTGGTGNAGVLFRVDRVSGQRTVVSDFGNAGQGELGVEPVGVAIVVPNCHGRLPTLVGDNGNNVLIGSPRADVILGRAGADRIDGRGGNDRICGGDGKDTLLGGSGNDRVSGDRGADTIKGGTGNDRLDGGKGRDRLDGGKGTDRCKSGEVKVGCER